MTDQELFTKVATHLLTQNARSGLLGDCRYRYGELSCAAGCLITDENYSRHFETFAVHNSLVVEALMLSGILRDQLPLVMTLQQLHDTNDVANWAAKLQDLANKRGFEMPVL